MSGTEPARLPLLDRALALFAPGLVLNRALARDALTRLQRRGYDAASRRGRFENWRAPASDAATEIRAGGPVLRARMRDLMRNSAPMVKAVQVLVDNIVGTGIRPRAITGNRDQDARINDLWEAWSAACDWDRHTDFHGLSALMVREMIVAGESLLIRHRLPARLRRPGVAPFAVEFREADHIDDAKESAPGSARRIVQGVEHDEDGRRVALWLHREHPGGARAPLASERVPLGERVLHLFERQRAQVRGVTWGAPVMRALREMDDWQEAEIERKKIEACLVGIVMGVDPARPGLNPATSGTSGVIDGDGEIVETFRPGMLAYASGATDVRFTQPAATGGVYEWHQVQMHIIAAGMRVPYELMTGDLSRVNFSSSRVGLNAFRRMIEALQWQLVIPGLCDPVWRWFCEALHAQGVIPSPVVPVEWDPPRFESVNPLQDVQADLAEVRAGFASAPQMIAKRGYDPLRVLAEQADFLAAADAAGLVLDSDPRRVSKAGQVQPDTEAGRPVEE